MQALHHIDKNTMDLNYIVRPKLRKLLIYTIQLGNPGQNLAVIGDRGVDAWDTIMNMAKRDYHHDYYDLDLSLIINVPMKSNRMKILKAKIMDLSTHQKNMVLIIRGLSLATVSDKIFSFIKDINKFPARFLAILSGPEFKMFQIDRHRLLALFNFALFNIHPMNDKCTISMLRSLMYAYMPNVYVKKNVLLKISRNAPKMFHQANPEASLIAFNMITDYINKYKLTTLNIGVCTKALKYRNDDI